MVSPVRKVTAPEEVPDPGGRRAADGGRPQGSNSLRLHHTRDTPALVMQL
ncbi:hypothetical protein GCM10027203_46180 [Nonomuraea fastidiosa]